jgi:hypothetical protein
VIHSSRTPHGICSRKDSGTDVTFVIQGETRITNLAVADHRGNVTCKRCIQYLKATKVRKQQMLKQAA